MERVGCIAIGYLFGMILTGDVVAHALSHESAFAIGDGNPGMANVGRALGRKAALFRAIGQKVCL